MSKEKETEEQKRDREVVEGIAKNISALARSVNALLNGPLKKKAIVTLLASSCSLPKRTVDQVLTAISELEKDWLNK